MSEVCCVRVLILDDDPDDALLIEDLFDELDGSFEIAVMSDPSGAVASLADGAHDVLLCDYRMGAVSGLDVIRQLRDAAIPVPSILMTGVGNAEIDREAMDVGAADFLPKDELTPELLDRAVRYAMAGNKRERLLRAVLDAAGSAVLLVEEGRVVLSNTTAEGIATHVEGGVQGVADAALACDERELLLAGRALDRTVVQMDGGRSLIALHDVTARVAALEERERAERRFAHAATHDALTGLPNRKAFAERIECDLDAARCEGRELAIMSFDLDRFKMVNDVHGHMVGDELLREVARRLLGTMGDGFVARLGGDEFVALVMAEDGANTAYTIARNIVRELSFPVEIDGRTVFSGSSIGIAVFPHHGDDVATLVANADVAMYRAKKSPLHVVCVFDGEMDAAEREGRRMVDDLRSAIDHDGLEVWLQPQTTTDGRELTGYEALARWPRPDGSFVPPDRFVELAETSGLIVEMGDYLLRKALRIARVSDARIAINVSPVQINHSSLPELLHAALVEAHVSPAMVEIEVTESALIENEARALHTLRQIRAMGVSVALDDFGTGYSSLAMLRSFPFDKIKLDRSFVNGLERTQNAAIVRTVIRLGEDLGMRVLCEGVETQADADVLAEMGCDEIQGYLIGRPAPPAEAFEAAAALTGRDEPEESTLPLTFAATRG